MRLRVIRYQLGEFFVISIREDEAGALLFQERVPGPTEDQGAQREWGFEADLQCIQKLIDEKDAWIAKLETRNRDLEARLIALGGDERSRG